MGEQIQIEGHWSPWVGSDYCRTKMMILGESCYLLEGKDGEWLEPERDHPRQFVQQAIDHADCRFPFFTKIARGLTDRYDLSENDWRASWARVAFTNFVPTFVDGRARARPSRSQWSEGRRLWGALLERLEPEKVLVLGRGLWDQMPETAVRHRTYLESYDCGHGSVTCLAVKHPAAGLGWKQLALTIGELEAFQ